jgi:hypothetical protein
MAEVPAWDAKQGGGGGGRKAWLLTGRVWRQSIVVEWVVCPTAVMLFGGIVTCRYMFPHSKSDIAYYDRKRRPETVLLHQQSPCQVLYSKPRR